MDTETRTTEEARKEAVSLIKRYRRAAPEQKTTLLRQIAEVLVDVRQHFGRADGSPDWKGRTHAYRQYVAGIYGDAGLVGDEAATTQAAVRYHVGIVLRDRLDDDTLAAYGLIPRSPRERSQDRRAERTAIVHAVTHREVHGGALLAISTAFALLSRLDTAQLDELAERERGVAEETLADVERRVKALRRRLKKA
jgi:hypothetical protein